jgi:hypothetical protein
MPRCGRCWGPADLPFVCNYCGGEFCTEHRLPEGHDYDGAEFLTNDDRWFREREPGEVVDSGSEFESPDPVEPDHTVGTTPDPDVESPPEVRTRSGSDSEDPESLVGRLLRRLFGR